MAATPHRNPQRRSYLTVVSVMILIGTEVFGVALASAWALAGLFELGEVFGYVLMAAFSVIGIYLMTLLWRHAAEAEWG